MFFLAVHGRRAGRAHMSECFFEDSPEFWLKLESRAVAEVEEVVCQSEFARKAVHTLALDHVDDYDGSTGHMSGNAGSMILLMKLSCSALDLHFSHPGWQQHHDCKLCLQSCTT